MSTAGSSEQKRESRSTQVWVAVVGGIFGIIAAATAAVISNASGGPITIQFDPQETATRQDSPTEPTRLAPTTAPVVPAERNQGTYVQLLSFTSGEARDIGAFSISGNRYDYSLKKTCVYRGSDPLGFATAGYKRITAVMGIADNERDTAGIKARITIRNESGTDLVAPFEIALGKPRTIDVPLNGAVQVQIDCVGQFPDGGALWEFDATFGNLAIHP
jgi:hypothetical protein